MTIRGKGSTQITPPQKGQDRQLLGKATVARVSFSTTEDKTVARVVGVAGEAGASADPGAAPLEGLVSSIYSM
jgi:hypothetical protein